MIVGAVLADSEEGKGRGYRSKGDRKEPSPASWAMADLNNWGSHWE
jgi:hypothetical protein